MQYILLITILKLKIMKQLNERDMVKLGNLMKKLNYQVHEKQESNYRGLHEVNTTILSFDVDEIENTKKEIRYLVKGNTYLEGGNANINYALLKFDLANTISKRIAQLKNMSKNGDEIVTVYETISYKEDPLTVYATNILGHLQNELNSVLNFLKSINIDIWMS